MVEKWSGMTIFIEKSVAIQNKSKKTQSKEIHKKYKKTIKYIRIKMEFAIFYDLQLLNMVKQIHTPKIRPKMLLISITWAKM